MCRKDYMKKMIMWADTIYIDTSSAMREDCFKQFLENTENFLEEENKKITILYSVYDELVSHSKCDNPEKVAKARNALEVINQYKHLFEIKEESMVFHYVIADDEIIQTLCANRTKNTQLLISNDRQLTKDAYTYNLFASVYAKEIKVCHLYFGYLKMSDCVKEIKDSKCIIEESYPKIIEVPIEKMVEKIRYIEKKQNIFEKIAQIGCVFVAGLTIGALGLEYLKR